MPRRCRPPAPRTAWATASPQSRAQARRGRRGRRVLAMRRRLALSEASVARMLVSEVAGRALHQQGVEVVFGLMGSGNLAITNALVAAGARFFSSRHESGAVS